VFEKYGIDKKIAAISSDKGSNYVKAIEVKLTLWRTLILCCQILGHPLFVCAAHILNCAVHEATVNEKVRGVWKKLPDAFSYSSAAAV
jgi:hypothetical protein